jgi:hypothetical protein
MLTRSIRKSCNSKSVKGAAMILAAGAIALYACSKDDSGSGASIGAPQAYPPTAAVTPGQLVIAAGTGSSSFVGKKTAATRANPDSASSVAALGTLVAVEPSTDAEKTAMLDTVKQRLFSEGPTNLLKLVKNVDDRMKDYDSRVASMSTAPECLSSTPVDLSTVFSVPAASGTTTFPLFGQCQETINNGGMTLMFGKKDTDWYLVDGASADLDGSASCVFSMSKISGTSDADRVVDGYMAVDYQGKTDNFTGSTTLMHFKADVAAGTLEFTAGGIGIGPNQVHTKSNKEYLYIQTQDRSLSGSASLYHACFSAADLSLTTLSNCSALQSSLTLVSLGTTAAGSYIGGGSSHSVPATDANNVDLTGLYAGYCGKLSTAFSGVAAFK